MRNIIKLDQRKSIRKLEESVTVFFLFGTSVVLIFLSQAIILALIGYFKFIPVLCAFIISCVVSFLYMVHIKKEIRFFPRISFPVIFIILLVSLIIIFYPHDNFGGTDNGIYINLAFNLAKNGTLNIPIFLQVPKIDATINSVPAYCIWLATQKILFGTSVVVRGNFLLIVLGLLSFFSVASMVKNKKTGFMSVAMLATSMPLLWFSRLTLTENLAFLLLWTTIFYFIVFIRKKRLIFLIYLGIAISLLCLTRPEGVFIFFCTLVALIVFVLNKSFISRKKLLVIITAGILLIIFFSLTSYQSTYHTILIALRNEIRADIRYLFYGKPFLLQKYPQFFSEMLIKYNFLLAILFTFIVSIQLIISFIRRKVGNYYFLALVIIILPEFYKLINPNIQMLQPWFYRRYMYSLIPLGYISLSFFLSNFKNKKTSLIIFFLVISTNFVMSYPLTFIKNNWHIYDVLEEITHTVTSNDLIILKHDRMLGYYWPRYYLEYQKLTRTNYSYNIDDKLLSLKDKTYKGFSFNSIYYLSDSPNENYKNYSLTHVQSFHFNYIQVKPSCELQFMAYENNISDFSLIPYSTALSYCKYPGNDIVDFKKQLYLYQLN